MKSYKKGVQIKSVESEFHEAQGNFAMNEAAEHMDVYCKPGTSAAKRRPDMDYMNTSYPTSRYRSRRP